MSEQEAIKNLEYEISIYRGALESVGIHSVAEKFEKKMEVNRMAIKALEKQIPKKTIALQHGNYRCPSCNGIIRMFEAINFCEFCGQAIDWGGGEKAV